MLEREPILVRALPDGPNRRAEVCSSGGRALEVELLEHADDCRVGTATELESREAIYLGMIERRMGNRVWVSVEHLLDHGTVDALSSVWRERETAERTN